MFGDPSTATEFPEEAIRFAAIDDRWGRIMQSAYETKNAMQVKSCLVARGVVARRVVARNFVARQCC